jgi:hypothetical protein
MPAWSSHVRLDLRRGLDTYLHRACVSIHDQWSALVDKTACSEDDSADHLGSVKALHSTSSPCIPPLATPRPSETNHSTLVWWHLCVVMSGEVACLGIARAGGYVLYREAAGDSVEHDACRSR